MRRLMAVLLLLTALTAGAAGSAAWAGEYRLVIDERTVDLTGHERTAITINGSIPGPVLRWREGEEVTIHVTNRLDEPALLHWHGILLPADMDGVPGLSFDGIAPGETLTYRFTIKQSGTYWYHSHSGLQEQSGVYGALIIEPAAPEPYRYDRDYVVLLSDWTDENPHRVLSKLKKQPDYYNQRQRTVLDFFANIREQGFGAAASDRLAWGRMRMNPTDIADVTGATYTFLVNGAPPERNWTALFQPGERVRLRFINGAAATYSDVRISGLPLRVVQADGQDIEPLTVDEFRIAVAETYDVIVEPRADEPYTIFAEAMDRSGYARASLTPRAGLSAPVPARRLPPLLIMADVSHGDGTSHGEHTASPGAEHGGPEPPHSAQAGELPAAESHAAPGAAHHDMAHEHSTPTVSAADHHVTHSAEADGPCSRRARKNPSARPGP